jgi:O-antigen ligase
LLFVLPVLALLADKAVVPWLITTAALAAAPWARGRHLPRFDRGAAILLAVLLIYAALSASWSPDARHALELALRLAVTIAAGLVLIAAFTALSPGDQVELRGWLLAGFALALAVLMAEWLSDFALWRLLHEPPASRYHLISGFNRGITLLVLLVWPVAFTAFERWGWLAALACPLMVAALIASYESAAGIVALLVGLLTGGLALLGRGATLIVLLAGLGAAFLVVPLVFGLAPAGVLAHLDIAALPATADVRAEIWRFVVARVADKPVLGWGLDAARFMDGTGDWTGESPIRLHPHTNPLQLLMELGLIAALLLALWLAGLAVRLARLGAEKRVCFAGFFASALVIASTAYGLWQTQWIASLLVAVAVMMLLTPRSPGAG